MIAISKRSGAAEALRTHWPEYLMEAAALGMFMVSACIFGVLLGHPASAIYQAVPNPLVRQILGGIAMGLTAVGIISSPWGKQSGAHMNPAFSLMFLSLGKIAALGRPLLCSRAVYWWTRRGCTVLASHWPPCGRSFRQLRRDGSRAARTLGCLRSGVRNFVPAHRDHSECIEFAPDDPLHTLGRRLPDRELYQHRITTLRHEHESGADDWIGAAGRRMDSHLGVFPRSRACHVLGRPTLPTLSRRTSHILRQISPPQRQALHLPVQLRSNPQ